MERTIELLLKRMESNPEEFTDNWDGEGDYTDHIGDYQPPKWSRFIYQLRERMEHIRRDTPTHAGVPLPFFSNNEIRRLYDKYVQIQGDEFEKYVLRELLRTGERQEPVEVKMSVVTFADPGAQPCT